jgi:hypothetical protein
VTLAVLVEHVFIAGDDGGIRSQLSCLAESLQGERSKNVSGSNEDDAFAPGVLKRLLERAVQHRAGPHAAPRNRLRGLERALRLVILDPKGEWLCTEVCSPNPRDRSEAVDSRLGRDRRLDLGQVILPAVGMSAGAVA